MNEIAYQVGEGAHLNKKKGGVVISAIFPIYIINGLLGKGIDIYNKFKRKTCEIE